jgi:chloramphenicol-sensitive protein RarD
VVEARRGTAYGVAAYLLWGLFPLYWPLLKPAGAVEILAHRIVWSLVVVVGVLAVLRSWGWVRPLLSAPATLARMSVAAAVIAVNWAVYIWGVNHDRVVETSLGYFINPLVTVLIGVLLLHERLRRLQWVAVGLGTIAVLVLTVDYGRPPWIALTLAFSFATYGLLKKQVGATVGAVQSLTVETAVLFLPALGTCSFSTSTATPSSGTAAAATRCCS